MDLLTSALLSLALASLGAAAPEPTKTTSSSESTTTTSEAPKTSTPALSETTTSARPWFLKDLSANIVEAAIHIRSAGVPESEASAVAHTLVDSALAHPQYTGLAQEALDILVDDGIYVNATSLYDWATNAKSAYEQIHTEPAYSSYIAYATSHATIYDFGLLAPAVPPRLSGIESKRAREQRAAFTSIYASLASDPTGSAAIDTLNSVASDYIRDFIRNRTVSVNVGVVESVLTYLLN